MKSRRHRGVRVHGVVTLFHSRGPNAVKTAWKVGPLRVVEIDEPIGQCASLQGNPGPSHRIADRLNYEWDIPGAGDVESEAAVLQPKVGTVRLSLRVPEQGREASKT